MRNLRRRLWDSLFLALCFSCSAAAQNTLERNPTSYLFQEFNPQLVIIIVSVTVLFFSGLFFIFSRLCLTGNDQTVSDQVATIPVSISTGLDPDTIKTFPTFSYSIVKSHKLGKGSLECAVCLCEFEEEETLRLLPQCSHVFHIECIDMWLSSHTTCPVCRFNLILDYDEVNSENSQSEDQHEVAIVIDENQHQEPPERDVIDQIDRLKPAKTMRFSRSYTTGHCLIQSENCDRFTLRLPENIREELLIIKSSRSGGRRLAKFGSPTKSDPWMVGRSQGFFKRTFSFGSAPMKSPVGDPTAIVKVFITPVKTTLDCLGVKSDAVKYENEESSSLTKSAC